MRTFFAGHAGTIQKIKYTADGEHLISSGSDKLLKIWDIKTGRMVCTIRNLERHVNAFSLSQDDRLLAVAAKDQRIRLWALDASDRRIQLRQNSGHDINAVAISPDGKHAVINNGATLVVWDISNRSIETTYEFESIIRTMDFLENGTKLLVVLVDGWAHIWKVSEQRISLSNKITESNTKWVSALSLDRSSIAIAEKSNVVHLFNVPSLGKTGALSADKARKFNAVAFSPDGLRVAAGDETGMLTIWDVNSGQVLQDKSAFNSRANAVVFSQDGGKVFIGGGLGRFNTWDIEKMRVVKSDIGGRNFLAKLVMSPDGKTLVSIGTEGEIMLWSMPSGTLLQEIKVKLQSNDVAFAPDGRFLFIPEVINLYGLPMDIDLWKGNPNEKLDEALKAAGVKLDGFTLKPME